MNVVLALLVALLAGLLQLGIHAGLSLLVEPGTAAASDLFGVVGMAAMVFPFGLAALTFLRQSQKSPKKAAAPA